MWKLVSLESMTTLMAVEIQTSTVFARDKNGLQYRQSLLLYALYHLTYQATTIFLYHLNLESACFSNFGESHSHEYSEW